MQDGGVGQVKHGCGKATGHHGEENQENDVCSSGLHCSSLEKDWPIIPFKSDECCQYFEELFGNLEVNSRMLLESRKVRNDSKDEPRAFYIAAQRMGHRPFQTL